MFDWLIRLKSQEKQRKALYERAPEGALKKFLSEPFADSTQKLADTPIIAVDFETTGLNAAQHKLLSIGYVKMLGNQIKLGSCYHQVIQTGEHLLPENVAIHQITDSQKNQGCSLKQAVDTLLNAMAGHVMLVHFATIEKTFLEKACLQIYGLKPVFPIIDTLMLEKNMRDSKHQHYPSDALRLSALRECYQLPGHFAHNALNDAIATAELLLAMQNHQNFRHKTCLSDYLL